MRLLRRDSIFSKLFLSLILLVSTLAGATCISLYAYSACHIKLEVGRLNLELLSQLKNITDSYILKKSDDFILENFIDISKNYNFSLAFEEGELSNRYLYDFYTSLKDITVSAGYIKGVHVYIPEKNVIISTRGIRFLHSKDDISKFDAYWINGFYNGKSSHSWLKTINVPEYDNDNIITLVRAYPLAAEPSSASGVIALDISESSIYSSMSNISPSTYRELFIIDSDGTVISHNNKSEVGKRLNGKGYVDKILASGENTGYFTDKVDNVSTVVSYIKSDLNSWTYVVTSDADKFYVLNNIIRAFIVAISFIIAIIGFLLAFFVSKTFYDPLKEMIGMARGLWNGGQDQNEYDILNGAFGRLHSELNDYKLLMEKNMPVLKHDFFLRLLERQITDIKEAEESLDFLNVTFEWPFFACAQISLIYPPSMKLQQRRIFEYSLAEFLEYRNKGAVSIITGQNRLAAIFNLESDNPIGLNAIGASLKARLAEFEDISYNIVFGSIFEGLDGIAHSYAQAVEIENYKFIYGYNTIIFYDTARRREESRESIQEKLYDNVSAALKACNRKQVDELVLASKDTLRNGLYSYNYVQSVLLKLISVVARAVSEAGAKTGDRFPEKQDLYSIIQESATLDETIDWIRTVCAEYIDSIDRAGKTRNSEIVKNIKEYIDSRIDEDISLDMIADSLCLSKSYISRLFKQETGVNYIDYISEKRLEKAAAMLSYKNIKVKDVCDKLGYNNTPYFISKFKEKYGMTPKQYQKEAKKDMLK